MAVLHQVIQRIQRLFNRRGRVEAVQLIEIDMIQLQAAQALLHAADDVIARAAARIPPCRSRFAKYFSGDYHVLARNFQVFQRLAEDRLRTPFRVNVRGVDKVDPGIQRAAHQLFCFALLELTNLAPHAAFTAEGHGAEAEFRNEQSGIAQFLITHNAFLACRLGVC